MQEEDSPVFGVYFGNSTCCLSVNKNGNVDVVANASGERVTPALVGYQESDVVIGTAARQGLVRHDKSSIMGALRALSSSAEEDLVFPMNLNCQLNYDGGRTKFCIQNGDTSKMILAQDILSHLFHLLKDIAGSHGKADTLPVVITLPSWVSESAKSAVHAAATSSGFQVIKAISQPAAGVLAYNLLDDNTTKRNILTLHCGGTSTVASVGEICGGMLNIKETCCNLVASGDALTSLLVRHFGSEFYTKYKGDPLESKRSKRKLYSAAENCKHVLSTLGTAQVHVDSLWEGVDFSTQLSRARFDGLISGTLSEFFGPVKEVLERTGLTYDQIDKVILSGGSSKIPKFQQMVSEKFPNSEILKKIPGDEILSVGAAVESLHFTKRIPKKKMAPSTSHSILSCLAHSIHAKVLGTKKSHCIFMSGTCTHNRQSIVLDGPESGSSILVIYEGKETADDPLKEQILVRIELNLLENGTRSTSIHLDCFVKGDGSMLVKVSEPISKTHKSFLIEATTS